MLALLLTFLLLTPPENPITGSLQTSEQGETAGKITTLSPTEVSDLQKRADSGDASAQFALGKAYESGNGAPQRPDQAAIWYRKAAEQGNAKAQNSLGVLYWLGEGVEKDRKQAIQWYRKAARQGDASAMFNLGAAYYNGDAVGINDTLAYAWFLLSSEAGSSAGRDAAKRSQAEHGPVLLNDAYLAIGEMYEKGEDLPQDLQLAASWYRKAAENRRFTEARLRLGILFLKSGNYNEARQWCETLAKEKVTGGAFCMGYLYQHGFGVTQDSKIAFKWYAQAANSGNITAMHALSQMYEKGEATKVDRTKAMYWLLMAAIHGSQDAAIEARKLRASMSEQEWKATQKKLGNTKFDPKRVSSILQETSPQAEQ
jgi:TPR repeat protein